ncbi:YceD family protein [Spiroplasma endosymbiont of Cantharis lateralis]|uniref:YceD family protein n=1 Tax=Spiroplasma endosymbiont of Cantharis lateralis TaxID=3066277 RepID=UPI00313C456D
MLKKDIELKGIVNLDKEFEINNELKLSHDLIKSIDKVHIKGILNYQDAMKSVIVYAKITASLTAIDARDGTIIKLEDQIYDWSEEYYFEDINDDQHNIVFGDKFNILEYAIEQIVLNIPMNLSNNYDKISFVGKDYILMSEDEYQQEQENQVDSRWDKLKEFNFEK